MDFGYTNGNCRQAASTQREAIKTFGVTKIWHDEKGDSGDFDHLTGEETGISRGDGNRVIVAEFHHLATNREDLLARVGLIHKRGAFVVEAMTGRSTEDRDCFAVMLLEATDFYRGGMSRVE